MVVAVVRMEAVEQVEQETPQPNLPLKETTAALAQLEVRLIVLGVEVAALLLLVLMAMLEQLMEQRVLAVLEQQTASVAQA